MLDPSYAQPKKRSIVFDIESTGLMNTTSIDYSSMPYKIKSTYKTHCIVAKDIHTKEIFTFIDDTKEGGTTNTIGEFLTFILGCDIIIGHNIINFDLLSLFMTHGLEYGINPYIHHRLNIKDELELLPDRLHGNKVKFIDTLVLSKLFNADRFGGHSLSNFGKILGNAKGSYGKETEGAWDKYSEEMLTYCIQDVNLNEDVYYYLLKEAGVISTDKVNPFVNLGIWEEAYQIEAPITNLITKSSHFGFCFDVKKAQECVKDLNKKLKDIEDRVHPQLPNRELPVGQQPKVPSSVFNNAFDYNKPFTKGGKLKKSTSNYLSSLGIDGDDNQLDYFSTLYSCVNDTIEFNPKLLPKRPSILSAGAISFFNKIGIYDGIRMITEGRKIDGSLRWVNGQEYSFNKLTEPMTLSNKDDVKQYIVDLGWKPTVWNETDMLTDSKKRKRNKDKLSTAIDRYVNESKNSSYLRFRCDHLGCTPETMHSTITDLCKTKKKVFVLSTPKYTVDKEKNVCPNLLRIKDKVPFINDVVSWLIYSHRKNSILSDNGTGWLSNSRLQVDSHIPTPADTLGAVTGRFTHRDVCNVARVTTLYGKEMRSLFGVDDWAYLVTADGDGLENRIEGHFCYKYQGGPEYAVALEAAKPNDFHTVFAGKLGIVRDDAKSVKYGLSYGQQWAGLAKTNGWSNKKAKMIYNGFWDNAKPLKLLKEAVERHWESNGRKYIVGLDGRKLPARAKHLLLNLLFQGSGVLCMKRQHIFLDRMLKDANLLGDPFKDDLSVIPKSTLIIAYHDEESQAIHKDLLRFKSFETKAEAIECKKELEEKGFILSDVNGNIPEICDGKYFIVWSKVIELTTKSMLMAGEYYNLNLKLTQSGQLGLNWSQTH